MVEGFLTSDHESLHKLLEDFEESIGTGDFRHAFELLDLTWARLATHIRAENLFLFPAILNAQSEDFGKNDVPSIDEVRAAIDVLRTDHNFFMNQLASGIKLMRAHLAAPQTDGREIPTQKLIQIVSGVKQRLDSHNQLEEEEVYRWPRALLSESDLALLDSQIRYQVQTLPSRFKQA